MRSARPDIPGRSANTPPRLSVSPAARRSSPEIAVRPVPPRPPVQPPHRSAGAPACWLAHSTPDNSATLPHRLQRPHRGLWALAPRTTPPASPLLYLAPSRSTPPVSVPSPRL